ncbi:MAG: hypothetical protein JXB32_24795 [Deltaproteobacteria bacterium]|nr:hypothetical protein [Deltaproteobacteria bacterium]
MAINQQIAEKRFVFCEDCDEYTENDGTETCGLTGQPTWKHGPLWPACRGFKLRPGAKGPEVRWSEHMERFIRDEAEKEGT